MSAQFKLRHAVTLVAFVVLMAGPVPAESSPYQETNWVSLGNQAFDAGEFGRALALYSQAIVAHPDNKVAYFDRARTLVKLHEPERAVRDFDAAIALDPTFHEAIFGEALALFELKRYEKALAFFNRAVDLNGNDPEYHSIRGNVLEELGRVDEAANEYRFAIKQRAGYIPATTRLARILVRSGDSAGALTYLAQPAIIATHDTMLDVMRAQIFMDLRKTDEAMLILSEQVQRGNASAATYELKAHIEYDRRNWRAVIADASEALSRDSGSTSLYKLRGGAEFQLGEYQAAIADFERLAASQDAAADLLRDLAIARFLGTRDAMRAESDLGRAIQRDRRDPLAYRYRAEMRMRLGLLQNARKDYSEAIALSAGDAAAWRERAKLDIRLRNIPAARDGFLRAAALFHAGGNVVEAEASIAAAKRLVDPKL